MKNFDGLLVFPSVQQEFGRLLEAKYHEAEEENTQANSTEGYHYVTPAHIASFRATSLTRSELRAVTSESWFAIRIIGARVLRDETIADGGCNHNTNGLKYG